MKHNALAWWEMIIILAVILLGVVVKISTVEAPAEPVVENSSTTSNVSVPTQPKFMTVVHTLKVDVPQGSVYLGDLVPGPKNFNVQQAQGVYHSLIANQDTLDGIVISGEKNFYLKSQLLEGDSLELKTYTRSDGVEITLSEVDEAIAPYIVDRSYCEDVSDCVPGYGSGCMGGFYNKYIVIPPTHGCYGDYSVTIEEKELMQCDPMTQHVKPAYSGPQCVQNKCVATTRTLSCAEGALP